MNSKLNLLTAGVLISMILVGCNYFKESDHVSYQDEVTVWDWPHTITNGIRCLNCHSKENFHDKGGSERCKTCHKPDSSGIAEPAEVHSSEILGAKYGVWEFDCVDCHNPHIQEMKRQYGIERGYLLRTTINGREVVFLGEEGEKSFADGDTVYDGVCEVCHTQTRHHRNDGSAPEGDHHDGKNCTECHPHSQGFMPVKGECLDCHKYSQNNGDGIPEGGRRAVAGEFVMRSHHLQSSQPDSSQCTVCHDQSTHKDGYVDLIDPDTGGMVRESYPGEFRERWGEVAQRLSSFCSSCHDEDGAVFYGASATAPFGDGKKPPVVSTHGNSDVYQHLEENFSLECVNCHTSHGSDNIYLTGVEVYNLDGTSHQVVFTNTQGENSFDGKDSDDTDDLCVTCHQGKMVKHEGGLHEFFDKREEDCTLCHPHNPDGRSATQDGFVEDLSCLGCHATELNVNVGRRNVGVDFDYPSGLTEEGHHPLTYMFSITDVADENNCLICHMERFNTITGAGVLHMDGNVDLNESPDGTNQPEWKGTYYSWWCIDCHDSSSPGYLGGKSAPDRVTYYIKPSVHYQSPSSADAPWCGNCHNGDPNDIWPTPEFYPYGANAHTGGLAYSYAPSPGIPYVAKHTDESICFECHGVFMNARHYDVNPAEWMEPVGISYYDRNVVGRTPIGIMSTHGDVERISDGTLCRECHDPHTVNRYQGDMYIDPNTDEYSWKWTTYGQVTDEFCMRCHDGSKASAPTHSVSIQGKACIDCHAVHGSANPFLLKLSSTELNAVSVDIYPSEVTLTEGQIYSFTCDVTGLPADRPVPVKWFVESLTGGTPGIIYPSDVSAPIPDPQQDYSPSSFTSTEIYIPDDITIYDLNLYVDITHPYEGDLVIYLEHVDTGSYAMILGDDFWGWNSFQPTWFDTELIKPSSRAPVDRLDIFYGESAKGTWRLTVNDVWQGDTGTLNGWKLEINEGLVGVINDKGEFMAMATGVARVGCYISGGEITYTGSGWTDVQDQRKTAVATINVVSGSPGGAPPYLAPPQGKIKSERFVYSRYFVGFPAERSGSPPPSGHPDVKTLENKSISRYAPLTLNPSMDKGLFSTRKNNMWDACCKCHVHYCY